MSNITFKDPGFHLAVLGALLDKGTLNSDSLVDLLKGISSDESHAIKNELARIKEAIRRLHGRSVSTDAVATIESLDFDGGNEIYVMVIENTLGIDTGGEENCYELRSLEGIEALTSLKSLDLDGHGYREADLDLGPLKSHPALTSFVLSGKCTHASALESLSKLSKLDVRLGSVDDPKVLDRLAARGVTVLRK